MTAALVVISDGRGYLRDSIPSLIANAKPEWFSSLLIVEDGGPTEFSIEAAKALGDWSGRVVAVITLAGRQGGAAAVQAAWSRLATIGCDYAFHLEEDWTFPGPIPFVEMVGLLEAEPRLSQVVLRRQEWWGEGPGGYIGDSPGDFTQMYREGVPYLLHQRGFWLNPCVYPVEVARLGWPEHGHEHEFTARLGGRPQAVFGTHEDPPRAIHIGHERAASWTW